MKPRIFLVVTSFCLAVTGCIGKSPQVTYYHLSPMEKTSSKPQFLEPGELLSVGVGPMRFPDVLDRPQIVTRTDANSYRINEFQRWGGSLPNEFTRVFAENLAVLLETESVAVFPWEKHFQPRYRVLLEVLRFDGRLGEFAALHTRWTITDSEGRKPLRVGNSSIEKPVSDRSYEALVKGLDQTLAGFSRIMADEIQKLDKK